MQIKEEEIDFLKRLKHASKRQHSVSNALVSARFVGLVVSREKYGHALGCTWYIHSHIQMALDEAVRMEPRLSRFHEAAKALYRRDEIEKDLEFYLGSKWRESVQKHSYLPAVQEYCNHLEKLKNDEPLFVAAHALTQLLAMSSGGVILGKLVRKGFGLNADKYMTEDGNYLGTESFSLPENGAALKLELKNSAEALGKCMNKSEQHRFMDEHCRVFELNNAWISQYPVGIISPVIGMAKVTIGPRIMIAGAAFGTVLLARYAYLKFKDT